ncbi:MAG: hypothetical protein PHC64_00840 [Candidatus Gastranaerophilales bacterium]|nr:hypothetical protein [Candidatus Gastranaerophilales bacterium]
MIQINPVSNSNNKNVYFGSASISKSTSQQVSVAAVNPGVRRKVNNTYWMNACVGWAQKRRSETLGVMNHIINQHPNDWVNKIKEIESPFIREDIAIVANGLTPENAKILLGALKTDPAETVRRATNRVIHKNVVAQWQRFFDCICLMLRRAFLP